MDVIDIPLSTEEEPVGIVIARGKAPSLPLRVTAWIWGQEDEPAAMAATALPAAR